MPKPGDIDLQVVCSDPKYTAKPAIQRTLEQLGARVVQRLTKDVTHIVYERRKAQRGRDRDAEQELQELYSRAERLDPRPAIVSPSWVEQSRTAKRRLVEKSFVIPRPKEALLLAKPTGRTPGSGVGVGESSHTAWPMQCPAKTPVIFATTVAAWLACQPASHYLGLRGDIHVLEASKGVLLQARSGSRLQRCPSL
jgi:hypothetical protein